MQGQFKSIRGILLDLVFVFILGMWWNRGFSYHGRQILPYGPDWRRLLMIIALICFWKAPFLFNESKFLRAIRFFFDTLLTPRGRWTVFGLTLGYAIILGIAQTLAIRYPLYDVGIFHQIIWNITQGNGYLSTISKAGNFLLDHFSPTLALITPAFWISGNSPLTLPVVQVFLIFGGIASWIYLAERIPHPDSSHFAAAVTVFALSRDSLWGNLRWGFHENSLYFCFISWALVLLFLNHFQNNLRKWLIYFLMVLAALSKEILLVNVAFALFIWAIVTYRTNRDQKYFGALLFLSGCAMLSGFLYFEHIPHPADKNYFVRYYSYLGTDLKGFFSTLFLHPIKTFTGIQNAIGTQAILKFIALILSPFVVPAIGWAVEKRKNLKSALIPSPALSIYAVLLMIALPSVAAMGLSTHPYLRDSSKHYFLEIWPAFICIAILWLARFSNVKWTYAAAILGLITMNQDQIRDLQNYIHTAKIQTPARAQMLAISQNESILANDLAGPWVANHPRVAMWPEMDFFQNCCPRWILATKDQTDSAIQKLSAQCKGTAHLSWTAGTWRGYQVEPLTAECKS